MAATDWSKPEAASTRNVQSSDSTCPVIHTTRPNSLGRSEWLDSCFGCWFESQGGKPSPLTQGHYTVQEERISWFTVHGVIFLNEIKLLRSLTPFSDVYHSQHYALWFAAGIHVLSWFYWRAQRPIWRPVLPVQEYVATQFWVKKENSSSLVHSWILHPTETFVIQYNNKCQLITFSKYVGEI